jgi:hypothetical protein
MPTPEPTPSPTPTPTPEPEPEPEPAPAPPVVIAPPPAPAPAIIFFPPAPAPAPYVPVEQKKDEKELKPVKESESATVKVVVPKVLKPDTPTPVAELTTQKIESKPIAPVPAKVVTSIVAPKVPTMKGTGPFTISVGVANQESSTAQSNPQLAAGVKVLSQTPKICTVTTTFNKATGKYAVKIVGVSNGQCRISAIDNGSADKYPSSLEIKQQITGIAVKKSVSAKTPVVPKTTSATVSKASYSTKK